MAVPTAPPAPSLSWTSPESFRVSWRGLTASPAVTSWEVRWRTAAGEDPAGSWQSRAGLGAAVRSFAVDGLDPGAVHEAQVRARNTDGAGPWSPSLTVTTQEAEAMTILQSDLTSVAVGVETADALVAATRRVPYVEGSYTPTVERMTLEEAAGTLADTRDVVVSRGSELELTAELDTENLLAALLCSLARVSPAADASAQLWTFTPSVAAPSGLATATWEISATDGDSAQYRARFGHARATEWSVEASGGATARLSSRWEGRAEQALASPANPDAPDRWIVPAQSFECFIDDSWAALGTSRSSTVRSLNLRVDPGLEGAPAMAGRADLDIEYWRRGRIRGRLELIVDHDASAGSELAHWKAGDLRYFRLHADNGLSGANARAVTFDFVGRYVDSPDVLARDGAVHTLALAADLRADEDRNILRVQVRNGLAAY